MLIALDGTNSLSEEPQNLTQNLNTRSIALCYSTGGEVLMGSLNIL